MIEPEVTEDELIIPSPHTNDNILYFSGNNWLQQNDKGLYELYAEGNGLQVGLERGALSQQLIHKQEALFVDKIQEIIPSKIYLYFLKEVVAWYNRNLPDYISDEYQKEIYGISRFASKDYDFIGDKYERVVNYHAAHDIGHALQNYNLVGCTSFARWQPDSNMLIGRNFDFSMGEKFAENKVVCFYHPNEGIDFMMISWSDFIGCVSGMNRAGLTVTINAGENTLPTDLGTPISLIAREIVQYAHNIEEAYQIALKRKSFVSESILIGSAQDGKTVIIEKTPDTTLLVETEQNRITCSNHFLSESLEKQDTTHVERSTKYRFERVNHLIDISDSLTPAGFASILRDQKGRNGSDIGMANEKSINQLVAHHSIIFEPFQNKFWISLPPFQLGEYLCYDLDDIFENKVGLRKATVNYLPEETIPVDSFLMSTQYANFRKWQQIRDEMLHFIDDPTSDFRLQTSDFISLNPQSFETFRLTGLYLMKQNKTSEAIASFKKALTLEAANPWDAKEVVDLLNQLKQNDEN